MQIRSRDILFQDGCHFKMLFIANVFLQIFYDLSFFLVINVIWDTLDW